MLGSFFSGYLGYMLILSPSLGSSSWFFQAIISGLATIFLKSIYGTCFYCLLGLMTRTSPSTTSSGPIYSSLRPTILPKSKSGSLFWGFSGSRSRLSPSASNYGLMIGSIRFFQGCFFMSKPYTCGYSASYLGSYSSGSTYCLRRFMYRLKASNLLVYYLYQAKFNPLPISTFLAISALTLFRSPSQNIQCSGNKSFSGVWTGLTLAGCAQTGPGILASMAVYSGKQNASFTYFISTQLFSLAFLSVTSCNFTIPMSALFSTCENKQSQKPGPLLRDRIYYSVSRWDLCSGMIKMLPPFQKYQQFISQSLLSAYLFCFASCLANVKPTGAGLTRSSWGQQQSGPGSISENLNGLGVDFLYTTPQGLSPSVVLILVSNPPLSQLSLSNSIMMAALLSLPLSLVRSKYLSLSSGAPACFFSSRSNYRGIEFQYTSLSLSLSSSCCCMLIWFLFFWVFFFSTAIIGGRFFVCAQFGNRGVSSYQSLVLSNRLDLENEGVFFAAAVCYSVMKYLPGPTYEKEAAVA